MTKKALVSTVEGESTAQRITEVVDVGNEFEVHSSLVWKDCADDVTPEHFYNSETNTFFKDNTLLNQQIADAGVINDTTHRYVWNASTSSWSTEPLPTE